MMPCAWDMAFDVLIPPGCCWRMWAGAGATGLNPRCKFCMAMGSEVRDARSGELCGVNWLRNWGKLVEVGYPGSGPPDGVEVIFRMSGDCEDPKLCCCRAWNGSLLPENGLPWLCCGRLGVATSDGDCT